MPRPLAVKAELRLIAAGLGQELLQLLRLSWLLPARRPSGRVIGTTILDATGTPVQVIGKDPLMPGRYIVQRADGSLITLAKSTIERRLR